MAVSGRKQTCKARSIDAGSIEDFGQKCEPCISIGQHIEAHGFCVHCQEYLCKTCRDCHKKTKALRNHEILGRDAFDQLQTIRKSHNECTEQCSRHQREVIKFYCETHSVLGCHDCMTLGHRACKIEYIPGKCVGIADGKEYNDIMIKLEEKLKETEEVSTKAERSIRDITEIDEDFLNKVIGFRAEINDRLDQMQQDILNKANRIKSHKKEILQDVIDACEKRTSSLKSWKSTLCADKSNNKDCQLYIDIKRAEMKLKSDEVNEAKEKMLETKIQYSFRRSEDLKNLWSVGIVFGEITSQLCPESTPKENTIDHLTEKDDINIKTKSDKKECSIAGCAVLPSNKLVLADCNNKKIKVVSVENKLVEQERILDARPFDIAVISSNQFAVTMLDKGKIDVMKTDGKLSRIRSIRVDGISFGIDFHQEHLYAACLEPSSVVGMTTQGNVTSKISLQFLSSLAVPYIVLRKESNLLYVSDTDNNCVASVSLQGDVSAIYKNEVLQGPRGICSLDDESLLVCCRNGTIHQIKDNLKGGKVIFENMAYPKSICYNTRSYEVYIGCNGNQLKVFSTK